MTADIFFLHIFLPNSRLISLAGKTIIGKERTYTQSGMSGPGLKSWLVHLGPAR